MILVIETSGTVKKVVVCRLDSIISDKDCRTCYLYRDLCSNWCGIRERMKVIKYYLEQYNDYTAAHKVCVLYSIAIATAANFIECSKCPLYCNYTNVVCYRLGCIL